MYKHRWSCDRMCLFCKMFDEQTFFEKTNIILETLQGRSLLSVTCVVEHLQGAMRKRDTLR